MPSPTLTHFTLSGQSLLNTLDALKPMERFDEKELRIPVLDKYKESGKLHILGKVETGVLRTGDTILCNPGTVFIIFIFLHVHVFARDTHNSFSVC